MICRLGIDKSHLHFIEQLGSLGQRRAFEQYNTRFGRGFVAMLAMSESGQTQCLFHNAWLWLIEG